MTRVVTGGASYFDYQVAVGRDVLVPWLARRLRVDGARVADFGSHHGGVLEAFRAAGAASGIGYELDPELVRTSPFAPDEAFRLEVADVAGVEPREDVDLVLLHDVLEHVPEPEVVLNAARRQLAPGAAVFVAFPPYYSAFGGHQQLALGLARVVPFVHYLPARLFFRVARPGENEYMSADASLEDMRSVRRARLTLAGAERAAAHAGLGVAARQLFLLRPEYSVRYGLPTLGAGPLGRIPLLREALVTGAYLLLRPDAGPGLATSSRSAP